MSRQHSYGRYVVVETDNFVADWHRGVSERWINPMADTVTLSSIKEALGISPWGPPATEGWGNNVRAITFPISARDPLGRVSVRYEVVEDDREVRLISINFIG